jgi:DNA replication licensing factor MCM4
MSSPPAVDFPSDDINDGDGDVHMDDVDGGVEQSMANAPPPEPLFLAGAASPATPASNRSNRNSPYRTPLASAVARRALGMTTPKKTPLFARQ